MTDSLFAIALRETREKTGTTLRKLADLTGIDTGTINGWERGKLPRRTLAVVKVARALGVSNDVLLSPWVEENKRRGFLKDDED